MHVAMAEGGQCLPYRSERQADEGELDDFSQLPQPESPGEDEWVSMGSSKRRPRRGGDGEDPVYKTTVPSLESLSDGLEALSHHFQELCPASGAEVSTGKALAGSTNSPGDEGNPESQVGPLSEEVLRLSEMPLRLQCEDTPCYQLSQHHRRARVTSAPHGTKSTASPLLTHTDSLEAGMTGTANIVRRHDVVVPKRSVTPPPEALNGGHQRGQLSERRGSMTPRAASKTTSPSKQNLTSPTATPSAQRNRGGRIQVVVRKRPLPDGDAGVDCIRIDPPSVHTEITKQRVDLSEYTERSDYTFDDAFDETRRNEDVYHSCAKGLLDVALGGGSASCFAYGQTGSGKTHTMMGSQEERGLFLLGTADLFDRMADGQNAMVSFYEIYCNSLFDLLNRRCPVVLREDGNRRVNICGLSWHAIASADELWEQISSGMEQRSIGSTSANERSSRSHAIMSIRITDSERVDFLGMLNFVDLAGSERAADTATNDRQTRLEGAEINKSLLALKECIRALDEKKRHVPFRGSRLTEVLRDSFVGNSKTVMIANISPSSLNYEHTANTLRYAFRVKGLSIPSVAPSKARNAPRQTPVGRSWSGAAVLGHPSGSPGRASAPSPSGGKTPCKGKNRRPSASLAVERVPIGDRDGRGNAAAEDSSRMRYPLCVDDASGGEQRTGRFPHAGRPSRLPLRTIAHTNMDNDVLANDRIRLSALLPKRKAVGKRDIDDEFGVNELVNDSTHDHWNPPPTTTINPQALRNVDISTIEQRIRVKVLRQLQKDLGMEIQYILDQRDAEIKALLKENDELRSTVARLTSEPASAGCVEMPAGKANSHRLVRVSPRRARNEPFE